MHELPQNEISEPKPALFDYMLAFEQKKAVEGSICKGERMVTSFLRPGDALILESLNEGANKSLVYKVTKSEWNNLSISDYSLHPAIYGYLEGFRVPDATADEEVYFSGSGWGGSSRRVSSIEPGTFPYFAGQKGEFVTPEVSDYGIARMDKHGNLAVLSPSEIKMHSKNIEITQDNRVQQVVTLMKKFGFENFDFLESKANVDTLAMHEYNDETFIAQYSEGMGGGNHFQIFNKHTRQMIIYKYFNYGDENMLQVAYADMTESQEIPPEKEYVVPLSISGTYRGHVPIVTFTTSPSTNVDTANYHPGDSESVEYLGLDYVGHRSNNFIPNPNIQIWQDGTIKACVDQYPFNSVEEEHPGTKQRLRGLLTGTWSPDGRHTFKLREKTVKTKNVDDVYNEIIAVFDKQ